MIQTPFELAGISRNTGEHVLITQYKYIITSEWADVFRQEKKFIKASFKNRGHGKL